MTFKIENITPIANNAKRGVKPVLWLFWNETNDDIAADNYFAAITNISHGDQVQVVNQARNNMENYHIVIDDDGVVKAVANTAAASTASSKN